MTQQPEQGAVGGATDEPIIAAEPTLEDRFAAFSDEDEEQPAEAPQGDGEGEPELDEADIAEAVEAEAAEPPIVAPVSWTAEEKAAFAELPRALQETLTRRESEREKFVQTKAQEAKQATQKAEQTAAERIAQVQNANLETLKALLPEIPQRPSAALMAQNPAQYAYLMEAHENAVAQHQYVQQVANQVQTHQQAAERAAAEAEASENEALLREHFPEYFGESAAELEKSLRSTATALGYSEDQLAYVNAQDVLAMRAASEWKAKADKFDTLMAKQMERVRDAKKLPKVSRPGVAVGKGAVANERYQSDRQAMRSGDRDAAVRLFSNL
jgi:hypothetical protein